MSRNSRMIVIIILILCFSTIFAKLSDILTKSDFLSINQTLISSGGKFELGFFHRGNPSRYYVGIWYKDIPSNVIIWVANRDSPSYSNSSTLKFGSVYNIVLTNGSRSHIVWKTNVRSGMNLDRNRSSNPVLELLDSGNLVIREAGDTNPVNFIWQSFDYPTDTILPGQKLGLDFKTGVTKKLVSWAGPDEPGSGNFSVNVEYLGSHEIYLRDVDHILYRSGMFNGRRFNGVSEMEASKKGFLINFNSSLDEVYYMIVPTPKVKTRTVVTSNGEMEDWIWVPESNRWNKFWNGIQDQCDNYGHCGPNSVCDMNTMFVCVCPLGFKPKNPQAWKLRDWADGCIWEKKTDCQNDEFLPMVNIKLPDTSSAFVGKNLSLDQCKDMCKKNCSCTAYTTTDFIENFGSDCLIWTSNLLDLRVCSVNQATVYIRIHSSNHLGSSAPNSTAKEKKSSIHENKIVMGIGICISATILLVGLTTLIIFTRISKNIQTKSDLDPIVTISEEIFTSMRDHSGKVMDVDDVELPIFDFCSMVAATDDFSEANKLGQGGFGRVYKGLMLDGQEVAVKRLSKESGQGTEEFKNEVALIANLQHRNLVRLLGCCVDMNEKMIIYEYLANKSLDSILFDKRRNSTLNWQTRFNIICGVARGMLYLHQDSRYRIIHRDLKASNILLDANMNPKISDFGMARIFGGDQTQGNTVRVVGTYGYMAPEFAMDGVFSIKSDVFSFGVLVLEILTGTKNKGIFLSDNELNLLGYVWEQWKDGKGAELLDKSIGDINSIDEALICLQVGLLCVQERPEDRPTMGLVVPMLSSESTSLPQPKLPGFRMGWNLSESSSSSSKQDQAVSLNQITVTMMHPR